MFIMWRTERSLVYCPIMAPTPPLFWEHWPGSPDVSEHVREKMVVKTKGLKESIYSGIPKLNVEVSRLLSIDLSLGECVGRSKASER